ncbi:hypothetical protein DNHGIG_34200 [Collibacillus ludicampi]|uniref:Uncharacterized protein n=2 Tax=Collibacillus ludicampi TaxID=2771369 RepID=A0AAV4LJE0_9BACL|nr:hypothetical protein DNHGIG_34200 [Collibacillus ludicampi]
MMGHTSDPDKDVAKAFYQLDFYLKILHLPFRVKDLYRRVYQKRLGDYYTDEWIDELSSDPDVVKSIHEPFTTQTIVETLMHTGHEPIIRALLREMRRRKIGFTQAYIMGINPYHDQ